MYCILLVAHSEDGAESLAVWWLFSHLLQELSSPQTAVLLKQPQNNTPILQWGEREATNQLVLSLAVHVNLSDS